MKKVFYVLRFVFPASLVFPALLVFVASCQSIAPSWNAGNDNDAGQIKRLGIRSVQVKHGTEKALVVFATDKKFRHVAYRMHDPERIGIEFRGATNLTGKKSRRYKEALVERIDFVEFKKAKVVRAEVWVKTMYDYSVTPKSGRLQVEIREVKDPQVLSLKRRLDSAHKRITYLEKRLKNISKPVVKKEPVPDKAPAKPREIEIPAPPPAPVQTAQQIEEQEIKRFFIGWITAWQKKNFESYLSCYAASPKFAERWHTYKKRKFEQAGEIFINYENLKISTSGENATLTFLQKYKAKNHSDTGLKTIRMRKYATGWKIVDESWKAARGS